MTLQKGGLAMHVLKIIENSRRRNLDDPGMGDSEGDGPWNIMEVSGVRNGFLSMRCVHCLDGSQFCDVLFKPKKSPEWESPHVRIPSSLYYHLSCYRDIQVYFELTLFIESEGPR